MPISKRRLAAAALGLAVILTVFASGLLSPRPAPRYTVTDLGVLPGYGDSHANAVNSRGDVAGSVSGPAGHDQACLYQGGKLISLGTLPGANGSWARGINAQGEITGEAEFPAAHHAFLYSKGKMQDLGTLPGFTDSRGVAINDRGEVTGSLMNLMGSAQRHAFLYSHGKITDLGTLPGTSRSDAQSINSVGQIAGQCYSKFGRVSFAPFLYDSRTKTMTALSMPPPYSFGYANAVNDRGQVAGDISAMNEIVHAALWDKGRMTNLGAPPGYTASLAQGLNNQGEVVGHCFNDYNPVQIFLRNHAGNGNALQRYLDRAITRAFVYRDGEMQDLNKLIPADDGWTLEDARSINDRGQIAGFGLHHGQKRAFLLTPIR